jgi:hypothetical protein
LAVRAEVGKLGVLATGACVRGTGCLGSKSRSWELGVLAAGAYIRGAGSLVSRSISLGTGRISSRGRNIIILYRLRIGRLICCRGSSLLE